jgi:hypothetical protein
MAIPPIFKFKNIKVKLTTTAPTFIYGVNSYVAGNNTLDSGIAPADITSIALTVQISNLSTVTTVLVDVLVQNSQSLTFNSANAYYLVKAYPVVPANAFDPLSGNLSLGANDQIWVTSNTVNGCDVVVSLLEIANATAS